jgi:hypothetical protein
LYRLIQLLRRERGLLAVVVALLGILLGRIYSSGVTPYGSNGAAYNEHATRLGWFLHLRSHIGSDFPGLGELLRQLETGFPQGLLALGALVAPLVGWRAEGVAPLIGMGSAAILAAAAGAVAWRLSGRASVVRAVVLGTLLLPAVHGASLRYYYDLPMSAALWAALGLFALGSHRRPLLAGASVGLLAFAACMIKWTTVPFLLPMLLGLSLTAERGEQDRLAGWTRGLSWPSAHRMRSLGFALVVWALFVGVFLWVLGEPNSLLAMLRESDVAEVDYRAALGTRAGFYLLGGVFAVFSPLLAVAALVLVALWCRGGAFGWPFVAACALGHLGFLLLFVRPVDERFILTLAPALVIAAALGWDGLLPPWRGRLARALPALGLAVALDFHHLPRTDLTPTLTINLETNSTGDFGLPIGGVVTRGVGAGSSVEQRGWARSDEVEAERRGLRSALSEWLDECQPVGVAAISGGPLIGAGGDHAWLDYEDGLAQVEERRVRSVAIFNLDCDEPEDLPDGVLFLTPARGSGAVPPPCLVGEAWRHARAIEDPVGGVGLTVWTREGHPICPE